jgi:hypothetical protein
MAITDFFYHGSTRKLIVAFGTLFNNITISRKDGKIITVPLTYASKEKFYLTFKQNYALNKMANLTLPRMGFIISDIAYDFERKTSSIGKFHAQGVNNNSHRKMYMPVPYDLNIELSIYSRNMIDGLQILEQIIPFFKPSFNITINELDPMGVMRDIPIILDSISPDDTSETDVADGFRLLRWDLSFTMKANYYGPIQNQKIIKKVYVDYYTSTDGEYVDDVDERYYLEIDPLDSRQEDLWDYSEELISTHDSKNTVILPVEIDIVKRNSDAFIYMTDTCKWEIIGG